MKEKWGLDALNKEERERVLKLADEVMVLWGLDKIREQRLEEALERERLAKEENQRLRDRIRVLELNAN